MYAVALLAASQNTGSAHIQHSSDRHHHTFMLQAQAVAAAFVAAAVSSWP
jgi:hypothetical protein